MACSALSGSVSGATVARSRPLFCSVFCRWEWCRCPIGCNDYNASHKRVDVGSYIRQVKGRQAGRQMGLEAASLS